MKLPLTNGAKVASAIYDADGVPVCIIDSMGEATRSAETEMARRIVACVNAFEGIDSDNAIFLPDNNVRKVLVATELKRVELERQRDELLAALEELTTAIPRQGITVENRLYNEQKEALEAIARVKGSAA